jgi:hypothetical protein
MAQAPKLSTQGKYSGKYIVKDLFPRNLISTGDDLFSRVETSPNGVDGIFDSKTEALEAIADRKLETGRGLSLKEINRKYKKFIKAEGFNSWEEADKKAKSRIKQAYALEKKPYETQSFFKKEGLSKRINVKTRELLEKKKPINPRTGLPYTLAEYTDLTSGQKQKLSLRMKGLKRKDVKYKPRQGYYPEKDANRLVNYMKIAAERQEKAGIPAAERTYTTVFDKNNKFIGVNDIRKNQVYTHVDYNLAKEGAIAGKVITQHPDYEDMQGFFKVAKKFKYQSPDKLLGSYFSKYERVPTYNEIYNFFTTDRNASLKTFKNNALTLQHQELISKEPTKNFQLLTQIKNTQAATIMNRLNRGEISSALANYELQKIGAAQEGLGVASETITPGKGLGVAKREAVRLFKDAVKVNPNIPDDMASRLNIKFLDDIRADAAANGPICGIVQKKNKGGPIISCVDAVEDAIQNNPQKLAQDASKIGKFKQAATGFLGFLKGPGPKTFGIGAGVGAAIGLVKAFRNDDPTSYLSNEDQQKSMLVDMATQPVSLDIERPAILDYQLPALGASVAGSTALVAPSTIKASKSRALGIERKPKGFVKTGLRVLGRGLGVAASPALLAPFAVGDIASQVAEGDTPEDIATNPFNYLYPAFADQTDKLTRGLSPTIRKVAKLGLPKIALRGLSRAGIGGFAASSVIQGLGLLDD